MLLFDEHNKTHIIDSINVPLEIDYFWVLDLSILDFTLAPLLTLEETVCPSLMVQIGGFEFILPASWSILVYDEETMAVDVVEIANATGRQFTSLVYGPAKTRADAAHIIITDYLPSHKNVSPVLNKNQMLCHPISINEWVCVSPSDQYSKYLRDLIVGDLIH